MKVKYYFFSLIPISIIAFIMRLFELTLSVEPSTGFYVQKSIYPIIFNVYCILVCLFFLSVLIVMKKEKKPVYRKYYKLNKPEKITILIASIFILASSIQNFILYLLDKEKVSTTHSFFCFDFFIMLIAIMTVLFAVLYATSSKSVIKSPFMSGLSIIFTIYYIIRLFDVFVDPATMLTKAYTSFAILFLGTTAIFFMNFSKMLAGTPSKKLLLTFGLCSLFFGCIRFAELILRILPSNPYQISENILVYLADTAILIVEVFTLLRLFKKVPKKLIRCSTNLSEQEVSEESN